MATVKVNLGQFEVYIVNALSAGGILPKMVGAPGSFVEFWGLCIQIYLN